MRYPTHLEENLGGSGWTIEAGDMDALGRFFAGEDERLQQAQVYALQSILTGELEEDRAFADLVYVLETLVDLDFVPEEEVMPLYGRLMPLRKQAAGDTLEGLRCVQAELRARFLPSLAAEPYGERRARTWPK